uniref:transporter substrate-binding domain-containing protein n=1 Tax=Halomicronema sp. CCY15110 TaxID=2767773 RepID=UPI00194DCAE7
MKDWAIALGSSAAILGTWAGAMAQVIDSAAAPTVRVGIYQNPPKVFVDPAGDPAGFWVDVLAAIAESENWTVEYVPCEWQACLDAVEAKQLDLMLDVAYSAARDRQFDFHQESVLSSWSVVYQHPSSAIDSILDLDQRRVGVVRGSIQKPTLAARASGFGAVPTFVEFDDFETLLQQLSARNIDAAVVNRFIGAQAETEYAIEPTNILVYPSQLYFVTAEGQNAALLAAIDERLRQLLAAPNSEYYQAEQQWLTPVNETLPSLRQALLDGLIYLPFIGIVGFALWNYALRQEVKRRLQTENRLQTLTNNTPGVTFQYLLRSNGTESLLYVIPIPYEVKQNIGVLISSTKDGSSTQ